MPVQFPFSVYILIIGSILSILLVSIAWRRRPARGAATAAILLTGCAIWCLAYALELASTLLLLKTIFGRLAYLGILLIPNAYLVFVIQLIDRTDWISYKRLAALTIEPALVILSLLTNPVHLLFYRAENLVTLNGMVFLEVVHGPLFYIHTIYSYFILIAGTFLLIRFIFRSYAIYRRQGVIIILGVLAPWILNLIYILGLIKTPGFDPTPIGFVITGMALVLGIYRYHLLDLTPIAREALIEVMSDGVVVIDSQNRIVDINPAGCRMFNCPVKPPIGQPAGLIFDPWPELVERYRNVTLAHDPIELTIGDRVLTYDLRITPLISKNQEVVGRLILVRNTTESRRVQQALQESESRYRSLVETSPDAIILTDLKGGLLLYNQVAADMHAVPYDQDLTGGSVLQFIASEDHEKIAEAAFSAMRSGITNHVEYTCVAMDGTRFPGEVSMTVQVDSDGIPRGYICVLRDITARKQTEDEILRSAAAERSQREIADALRDISNDLNATLDFDEILDRLLIQLERVVPYDSANITLVDGNRAYIARTRGYEKFANNSSDVVMSHVFDLDQTENFKWMLEHRQPLIIPDAQEYSGWVWLESTRYIRSWIGAPIISGGTVLAFFSIDKAEPNFYQPVHVEIVRAFAAQAGLALQNAKLYKETHDLLTREQRLNEILQRVGSSLDLEDILKDILRLACELVNADAGSVGLLDSDKKKLNLMNCHNISEEYFSPSVPENEGVSWQAVRSRTPILMENFNQEETALLKIPGPNIQSLLMVPIMGGQEVLGVFNLIILNEAKKFSPRDIPMAEAIGREAGVAVQNARLFENARRRAEEAETLRSASNAVTSALEVDRVLNEIIENLEKVVPYDSCAIFFKEDDHLQVMAGRGFPNPDKVLGRSFSMNNPLVIDSFRDRRVIILEDAQKDPRFQNWGDSGHVRGWMGIPLTARGSVTGFLTVDSRQPNAYTEEDSQLAQAFGNQAAIAIENARLFEKIQKLATTDPLTGLLNRRHFFELSRHEFYRVRRYGGKMSVIMIDIDDLKLINDTYGHQVGDQLVELIGQTCRNNLRKADIPARYAGDEFIIALPESNLEGALSVANRIKQEAAKGLRSLENELIPVSISLGVSQMDENTFSLETLINQADQVLYAAKQAGKNQIYTYPIKK